jgi:hypothetical protein
MARVNRVRIPQGEANKSAIGWGNLRAKGGVVPPSVFNLPGSCAHQINFFTRPRCLLLHLNSIRLFLKILSLLPSVFVKNANQILCTTVLDLFSVQIRNPLCVYAGMYFHSHERTYINSKL